MEPLGPNTISIRSVERAKADCWLFAGGVSSLLFLGAGIALNVRDFSSRIRAVLISGQTAAGALALGPTAYWGYNRWTTRLSCHKIESKPLLSEFSAVQSALHCYEQTGVIPSGRVIADGNTLVFELDAHRGLVFKVNKTYQDELLSPMETREETLQIARGLCQDLDLLVVPDSQLFRIASLTGGLRPVVAETKLNITNDYKVTEATFQRLGEDGAFVAAMRQLAIFISRSDFTDVALRNIPLIEDDGQVRVALIDVEHSWDGYTGFFGDGESVAGLLNCVPPALAEEIRASLRGI